MLKKIVFLLFLIPLLTYSQNYNKTKLITTADGLPSNLVYSFLEDNDNYIWFATDNGVAKYNGTSFKTFTTKNGLPTNDIFGINLDSKNRIWLESYQDGLFYIENDSIKFIKGSIKSNGYRFLYEKNNEVYFYTNYDLDKFLLKNGELIKQKSNSSYSSPEENNFKNKSSIEEKQILKLLNDNEDQWVIDKSNSLYRYKTSYINAEGINDFSQMGICHDIEVIDDKVIFLNKDYQLHSYDFKTKKSKYIKKYMKNNHGLLLKNEEKIIIPSYNIVDTLEFDKGKLKINSSKDHTRISGRYSSNLKNQIYTLGFNGIKKVPKSNFIFELKNIKLRLNHIKAIDEKNIITSNENGIHKINLVDSVSISNFNIKNTVTINSIRNTILVGTLDGLKILDKDLIKIAEIPLKSKVTSIVHDKETNFIYLISDKGVVVLDEAYKTQRIINQFDGLPNDFIIDIVPNKNELLVLHSKGFSIINKKLIEKTTTGKLDVISFKSKDSSFNFNTKMNLSRTFNDVTIENSIKTHDNPANFEKFYALSRNCKPIRWVSFKENNLNFKNLSPGNYELWLGVKKISDTRIIENKSIIFSIQPFFWETSYFIYFVILATFLLTYYIINIYKKREKEKYIIENKLSTLEIKAMKSQMNPHFIFNSLNNIQSAFLLEDQIKSNIIFVNFSKLLRTTLEMVNKDKITLEKEIEYIENYIAVMQSNHDTKIQFNCAIDNSIRVSDITLPVLIIQPIIENSIIHGLLPSSKEEKQITINVKNKSKETILIDIVDNGIGRSIDQKNKEYSSYGTSIIKNRIKLLNKSIKKDFFNITIIDLKENSENSGTLVRLQMPKNI